MLEGHTPSPTSLPCRQVTVRRPRLAQLLAWLGVVLFLVLLPVFALLFPGLLAVVAATLAAGIPWVQAARIATRSRKGGMISLEPNRALRITDTAGDAREIPFRDVLAGYEAPTQGAAVLHLRNGSQLVVRLAEGGAARVLAHLGVGASQRALTLPLRRTLGAFTIGFVFIWPLLLAWTILIDALGAPGNALALGTVLAILSTLAIVWRFGFSRVVIGIDGIRTVGGLRPRFVPYRDIAGVRLQNAQYANAAQSVHVMLHDGSALELPTIGAPKDRLEGIARRIEEATRAHASGASRRIDVLARGDRSLATWKEDLTRLALAPPGFRDHALQRDDFERVVLDASAAPDERIGAALALRAIDPAAARPQIRVAAEASADEAVGRALSAAAEDALDEETLERAAGRSSR